MNLKEKLKSQFGRIHIHSTCVDPEFDVELENHSLGDQNVYRLHFINYHRIGISYGRKYNNIGVIDIPFKPFTLPTDMNRTDAFKVLSYLTDFIEKKLKIEQCSYQSVAKLDRIIDLERLGFKRAGMNFDNNSEEIIDLFTITGRLKLFKDSKEYKKYFEWYMEGITLDEVKNIYSKYGIEFYDVDEEDYILK